MAAMAIRADDIDEMKAEEARLAEKLTDEEQATVQPALLHSLTQLKVKRPAPQPRHAALRPCH